MLEDIRNADPMPLLEERRSVETDPLPVFVKFVVVASITMTAASAVLMKIVAHGF